MNGSVDIGIWMDWKHCGEIREFFDESENRRADLLERRAEILAAVCGDKKNSSGELREAGIDEFSG